VAAAKIVLVGAGSIVFGLRLVGDLCATEGVRGSELVLVDIDTDRLELVSILAKRLIEETGADLRGSSCTDFREALPGADFVISTVAQGGWDAWLNDVAIPRKFGYYYAVGDTMGPGGMARAFRTIPIVLDIAKYMEKVCPNALLINYSNPMTAICRAVQKYTSIKIIGLCHGLQNTVRRIAPRIGYQAEDVQAWAAGVNHFIWLTSLLDRSGRDLYPVLKRHARENWEVQPLAYDLLELYGLFVSGGDDHIVEFMPEYASPDCVEKYMLDMDYVQKAVDHQQQEIAELRRLASDENKRVSDFITGSAESAAEIIDCLTNKKTELFMANVRNEGKIPGLPYDAVVEVPCVTTPSGLKGIMVDPLPSGVLGRIQTCLSEYELVVDAAVLKDRKLAVQAMLVCPATTSRERAEGVVDAMLAANKQYIGDFR